MASQKRVFDLVDNSDAPDSGGYWNHRRGPKDAICQRRRLVAATCLLLFSSAAVGFESVVVLDDLGVPLRSKILKDDVFYVETGDDGRAVIKECERKSALTAVPVFDTANYVVPSKPVPCGLNITEARLRVTRKLLASNALKLIAVSTEKSDWPTAAIAANELISIYTEISPQTAAKAELTLLTSVAMSFGRDPEKAVQFDAKRGTYVISGELSRSIDEFRKRIGGSAARKEALGGVDVEFLETLSGRSRAQILGNIDELSSPWPVLDLKDFTSSIVESTLTQYTCSDSSCTRPFHFPSRRSDNAKSLSVAKPAYMDYAVRSKITGLLFAISSIKFAVSSYFYSHGRLPTSVVELDFEPVQGSALSAHEIQPDGRITANHREGVVTLRPEVKGEVVQWSCTTQGIPDRFVPAQCRQ